MKAVFNPVLSDDVLLCFTQIINQSDPKLMDNDKAWAALVVLIIIF